MQGSGRQGSWLARLYLVAFLVLSSSPQQSSGLNELVSNAFKILKDLPNLGRALKQAVHSTILPVFHPGGATARAGRDFDNPSETFCYGELGCLSITDDFKHPIYRPINLEPFSREKIGVTFRISSREDPEGVVVPGLNVQKARQSSFRPNRPTKVVIHGFLNGRDMPFLQKIPGILLRNYDVNTIWVDWTDGSIALYNRAVANARLVGLEVAHLINWLKDNMDLNPADVHLIGHSLGSHISGYAGERISGLGRITGLDPAEPFFQHMPTSVRLDPSDARFVDVIHTDSESILNIGQGYGLRQPVGHLDFYPNDGKKQPGCKAPLAAPFSWLTNNVRFAKVWHAVEDSLGCNHMRAAELFSDSIETQCPYMAFRCNSFIDYKNGKCTSCGANGRDCALMGLHADSWSGVGTGQEQVQLFTSTGPGPHYCKYHYQIEVELGYISGSERIGHLYTSIIDSDGKRSLSVQLTNGQPRSFKSYGQYSFFIEHSDDLNFSTAQVKWVAANGGRASERQKQTELPLRKIKVCNVDTQSTRNRISRTSEFTFCGGHKQPTIIRSQETIILRSSHC